MRRKSWTRSVAFSWVKIKVKIGGTAMKDSMMGVGMHNDVSFEDNEFMINVRNLVNADPDLLGNEDIMKFVKVSLFKAGKNEPLHEIAKELDEELSGY